METKRPFDKYYLVAGITAAIFAVQKLTNMIRWSFSFTNLLLFMVYTALAVLLFLKMRDAYALIPLAVIALLSIVSFFSGFAHGWYEVYTYDFFYDRSSRFSFLLLLFELMDDAAYIGLLFVAAANSFRPMMKYRDKANSLWFVPALLEGARYVLGLIVGLFMLITGRAYYSYFPMFFWDLLTTAFLLFTAMWFVFPNGMIKRNVYAGYGAAVNRPVYEKAYCGMAKHVLLLLFTFGIWLCIWIYRVTEYLNCVRSEKQRDPAAQLLLCIFIPFYYIYWTYKSAQLVDTLARERNVSSDLSTICLVLAIFVAIIPPILIQDKINSIITASGAAGYITNDRNAAWNQNQYGANQYNANRYGANQYNANQYNANRYGANQYNADRYSAYENNTIEALMRYKELLDRGIITQAEFEAKKRQLLGL